MSRHRAVRNLDLDEEMAEDDIYADEDPYENITPDERFELEAALAQAQEILGSEEKSGLTEREVKDALWDAYFDVDQAVRHLMEEKSKREARDKKKAGECTSFSGEVYPSVATSTLSALQRLSLSRKAAASKVTGAEQPASIATGAGAKRAQRIAGLSGGGRAKMAKQALASLAPDHLQARSQQSTGAPELKPSKLQALAAARQAKSATASGAGSSVASSTDAQAKPQMSKLQQRVAAAKAAKEKALITANGEASEPHRNAIAEGKPDADTSAAHEETGPEFSLSGIQVDTLFPKASLAVNAGVQLMGSSVFGSSLCKQTAFKSGASASSHGGNALAVPGGSPFDALHDGHELLKVFAGPSPDDTVLKAREGTRLAESGMAKARYAAKPTQPSVSQLRKQVEGLAVGGNRSNASSTTASPQLTGPGSSGAPSAVASAKGSVASTPKAGITHERVVEEFRRKEQEGKPALSLVVVGHVDAGKSTMMGRLLFELGTLSEREHVQNERSSQKLGKGSFAYAWALDSSEEERARGVTIDVAQDNFDTSHRHFTLLDAPGHRDFIPNMISGAAQADAALLVIDAAKGAFEAGFGPHGQTREHALLVRSLGVQQLVVVVNKMDALDYEQQRFDNIVTTLKPFLAQTGFDVSKVSFVPCGAAVGENLSTRDPEGGLQRWYTGPKLVEVLDKLDPPSRQLDSPLRMPVTNVFKGQTAIASGVGAAGRVISGIVQIGDRLRVVPGDETAIVRHIEQDGEPVPWAVAGANVTAYLSGIDQIHVNVGSVLCPPSSPVPLCTSVLAQVLVFQPTYPLVAGTNIEVFHHSANIAATLSELIVTIDKGSGAVLKRSPRVLAHGTSAQVRIALRAGGSAGQSAGVPMEEFKQNKEMARILLRRNGETVAAGIVLECL
ncbi:hypothetical protein K437DRAFT_225393 [Tilletiaria anomala UBC 951]|uniref:Elongation factor 1 alpha-like protein n=1 Tax=Tilletiaria anomala (strain ATCC 24038 / CBS 436.72 / UBC 951) TaxID=1037660 RepID=A0A066VPW8_TILAU|nr:uncharacterized protein K437DRAFT_225393 [Tilletiaria anomala UBC 951]KDN43787.1 hypothetical protein K437DRAFT_225393 [Tilletiaria anomala UBC 951]